MFVATPCGDPPMTACLYGEDIQPPNPMHLPPSSRPCSVATSLEDRSGVAGFTRSADAHPWGNHVPPHPWAQCSDPSADAAGVLSAADEPLSRAVVLRCGAPVCPQRRPQPPSPRSTPTTRMLPVVPSQQSSVLLRLRTDV